MRDISKIRNITNSDITPCMKDTINKICDWDVTPGACSIEIHAYALNLIALELKYCWDIINNNQ